MRQSMLRNERGIALVLALLLLVVMSLIGVMTLNTTDTELKITSNYKRSQQTLSDATSIISYMQINTVIYTNIEKGSINLTNGNPAIATQYETDIARLGNGLRMREVDEAGNAHPEWNRVEYLSSGPLPQGSLTQINEGEDGFEGRYYLATTTVEDQTGSVARVESQQVRLVARSN